MTYDFHIKRPMQMVEKVFNRIVDEVLQLVDGPDRSVNHLLNRK